MGRDALIANLEWLLSQSPEPEREADELGLTMVTGIATLRMIDRGQTMVISRRYIREIIRHLKD